ncbi:MAG: hypothetical protein K8R21_00025, partial [Leptospira sp.]|nr:hypothetical protein [Leptospira sp.]
SGKISRFEFKFDLFLPDSDKRNKQGEVIESGFIGMGSYPGNSVILSQGLNFYPSGWITPVGLEKRNSIETGRMNSARALSGISFHSGKSVFELNYDYLIPRTIAGESPGSISVQKRDYAKYFLSELSFIIRHGDRNRDNYYLGLIISKLLVPGNLHLSATAIIFQAGFFF